MTDREMFPAAAYADFLAAIEGINLTPAEQRIVDWAKMLDQPTLNAFADIIRKARML